MDITDILLFSAEVDCLMYLICAFVLVFYTCGAAPQVRSALRITLIALLRIRRLCTPYCIYYYDCTDFRKEVYAGGISSLINPWPCFASRASQDIIRHLTTVISMYTSIR